MCPEIGTARLRVRRTLLRGSAAAVGTLALATASPTCAGATSTSRILIRRQRRLWTKHLRQRLVRALLIVDSASASDSDHPNHHVVDDDRHAAGDKEEALWKADQLLLI